MGLTKEVHHFQLPIHDPLLELAFKEMTSNFPNDSQDTTNQDEHEVIALQDFIA